MATHGKDKPIHVKNITIRLAQDNQNGTGQWLEVGKLYKWPDGNLFISFNSLALAPQVLMLVPFDRNVKAHLFDPDGNKPLTAPPYAVSEKPFITSAKPFADMDDDIPF